MEVTDMILDVAHLIAVPDLPMVNLYRQTPVTTAAILDFVAAEHSPFSRYYASPPQGTDI